MQNDSSADIALKFNGIASPATVCIARHFAYTTQSNATALCGIHTAFLAIRIRKRQAEGSAWHQDQKAAS
jgi:hypothetical protein